VLDCPEVAFETVTVTGVEAVAVPAVSVAVAASECAPFVAVDVFHDVWYGLVVTALPRFTPSSMNCTLAIPTLLEAFAETVTVPETVALAAGAVMETVGGGLMVPLFVENAKSPLIDSTPLEFFERTR